MDWVQTGKQIVRYIVVSLLFRPHNTTKNKTKMNWKTYLIVLIKRIKWWRIKKVSWYRCLFTRITLLKSLEENLRWLWVTCWYGARLAITLKNNFPIFFWQGYVELIWDVISLPGVAVDSCFRRAVVNFPNLCSFSCSKVNGRRSKTCLYRCI